MSKKFTFAGLVFGGLLLFSTFNANAAEARGHFAQHHPRRAEVMHRDHNINHRLNKDYGHLGGHYGQLKAEDRSIHRQQRRDARMNGGYITKGEQHHLNREENRLNRQIRHDQ